MKGKQKQKKKKKQEYVSADLVAKFHDNPQGFFSAYENDLKEIESKGILLEECGSNFLCTYVLTIAKVVKEESNYEQYFLPFFQLFKNRLTFTERSKETILHYLAKRRDKSIFFYVFELLKKNKLITTDLLVAKDFFDLYFFDHIVADIKINYLKIIDDQKNYEKYKSVIEVIKENNLLEKYDEGFFFWRFFNKITFDMKNLKDLSTQEINNQIIAMIKEFPEMLFNFKKANCFNFLKLFLLTDKDEIIECFIKAYEGFLEEEKQIEYLWCIRDSLFWYFLLCYKKKKNLKSIKCILEYLSLLISNEKYTDKLMKELTFGFMKRNIYHAIFLNTPKKEENEQIKILDEVTYLLFENNEHIITHFLSQTDTKGYYPFNYFLFNYDLSNEKNKKVFNEIFNSTDLTPKITSNEFDPFWYLGDLLSPSYYLSFLALYEAFEKKQLIKAKDIFKSKPNQSFIEKLIHFAPQQELVFEKIFDLIFNEVSSTWENVPAEALALSLDFCSANVEKLNKEKLTRMFECIAKEKKMYYGLLLMKFFKNYFKNKKIRTSKKDFEEGWFYKEFFKLLLDNLKQNKILSTIYDVTAIIEEDPDRAIEIIKVLVNYIPLIIKNVPQNEISFQEITAKKNEENPLYIWFFVHLLTENKNFNLEEVKGSDCELIVLYTLQKPSVKISYYNNYIKRLKAIYQKLVRGFFLLSSLDEPNEDKRNLSNENIDIEGEFVKYFFQYLIRKNKLKTTYFLAAVKYLIARKKVTNERIREWLSILIDMLCLDKDVFYRENSRETSNKEEMSKIIDKFKDCLVNFMVFHPSLFILLRQNKIKSEALRKIKKLTVSISDRGIKAVLTQKHTKFFLLKDPKYQKNNLMIEFILMYYSINSENYNFSFSDLFYNYHRYYASRLKCTKDNLHKPDNKSIEDKINEPKKVFCNYNFFKFILFKKNLNNKDELLDYKDSITHAFKSNDLSLPCFPKYEVCSLLYIPERQAKILVEFMNDFPELPSYIESSDILKHQFLQVLEKILPKLNCDKKFEIMRFVLQKIPNLLRCINLRAVHKIFLITGFLTQKEKDIKTEVKRRNLFIIDFWNSYKYDFRNLDEKRGNLLGDLLCIHLFSKFKYDFKDYKAYSDEQITKYLEENYHPKAVIREDTQKKDEASSISSYSLMQKEKKEDNSLIMSYYLYEHRNKINIENVIHIIFYSFMYNHKFFAPNANMSCFTKYTRFLMPKIKEVQPYRYDDYWDFFPDNSESDEEKKLEKKEEEIKREEKEKMREEEDEKEMKMREEEDEKKMKMREEEDEKEMKQFLKKYLYKFFELYYLSLKTELSEKEEVALAFNFCGDKLESFYKNPERRKNKNLFYFWRWMTTIRPKEGVMDISLLGRFNLYGLISKYPEIFKKSLLYDLIRFDFYWSNNSFEDDITIKGILLFDPIEFIKRYKRNERYERYERYLKFYSYERYDSYDECRKVRYCRGKKDLVNIFNLFFFHETTESFLKDFYSFLDRIKTSKELLLLEKYEIQKIDYSYKLSGKKLLLRFKKFLEYRKNVKEILKECKYICISFLIAIMNCPKISEDIEMMFELIHKYADFDFDFEEKLIYKKYKTFFMQKLNVNSHSLWLSKHLLNYALEKNDNSFINSLLLILIQQDKADTFENIIKILLAKPKGLNYFQNIEYNVKKKESSYWPYNWDSSRFKKLIYDDRKEDREKVILFIIIFLIYKDDPESLKLVLENFGKFRKEIDFKQANLKDLFYAFCIKRIREYEEKDENPQSFVNYDREEKIGDVLEGKFIIKKNKFFRFLKVFEFSNCFDICKYCSSYSVVNMLNKEYQCNFDLEEIQKSKKVSNLFKDKIIDKSFKQFRQGFSFAAKCTSRQDKKSYKIEYYEALWKSFIKNNGSIKFFDFIKDFTHLSKKEIFLNGCLGNEPTIVKEIYPQLNEQEKIDILSMELNKTSENIIHYLVLGNYIGILSGFLKIIKSHKEFSCLLYSFNLEKKEEQKQTKDTLDFSSLTPLTYSIIEGKNECLAMLLEFYSFDYIAYSLSIDNPRYELIKLIQLNQYFKDPNNKARLKKINSHYVQIFDFIDCFLCTIKDDNLEEKVYQVILIFPYLLLKNQILTKSTFFKYKNDKLSKKISLDINSDFQLQYWYILIRFLKFYPTLELYEIFLGFNIPDLCEESFKVYILFLMEEEGFPVIPIKKYLPKNLLQKYEKTHKEVDEILKNQSFKGFSNGKDYQDSNLLAKKIKDNPNILSHMSSLKINLIILFESDNLSKAFESYFEPEKFQFIPSIICSLEFVLFFSFYYYEKYKSDSNYFVDFSLSESFKKESSKSFSLKSIKLPRFLSTFLYDDKKNNENQSEIKKCEVNNLSSVFPVAFLELIMNPTNFVIQVIDNLSKDKIDYSHSDYLLYEKDAMATFCEIKRNLCNYIKDENNFFEEICKKVPNVKDICKTLSEKINPKEAHSKLYKNYKEFFNNDSEFPTYLKNYYEDFYHQDLVNQILKESNNKNEILKYFAKLRIFCEFIEKLIFEFSSCSFYKLHHSESDKCPTSEKDLISYHGFTEVLGCLNIPEKKMLDEKQISNINTEFRKKIESFKIIYEKNSNKVTSKENLKNVFQVFADQIGRNSNFFITINYIFSNEKGTFVETVTQIPLYKFNKVVLRRLFKIILCFMMTPSIYSLIKNNIYFFNKNGNKNIRLSTQNLLDSISMVKEEEQTLYDFLFSIFVLTHSESFDIEQVLSLRENFIEAEFGITKDLLKVMKRNNYEIQLMQKFFTNKENYGFVSIPSYFQELFEELVNDKWVALEVEIKEDYFKRLITKTDSIIEKLRYFKDLATLTKFFKDFYEDVPKKASSFYFKGFKDKDDNVNLYFKNMKISVNFDNAFGLIKKYATKDLLYKNGKKVTYSEEEGNLIDISLSSCFNESFFSRSVAYQEIQAATEKIVWELFNKKKLGLSQPFSILLDFTYKEKEENFIEIKKFDDLLKVFKCDIDTYSCKKISHDSIPIFQVVLNISYNKIEICNLSPKQFHKMIFSKGETLKTCKLKFYYPHTYSWKLNIIFIDGYLS